MKPTQITVFIAEDGREFRDQTQCQLYEANCALVEAVMREVGPRHRGERCDYENGAGYVQRPFSGDELFRRIRALPGAPHPRDCDDPWSTAYYRAMCIDSQGREWGQPYFATNPHEATMKEIIP